MFTSPLNNPTQSSLPHLKPTIRHELLQRILDFFLDLARAQLFLIFVTSILVSPKTCFFPELLRVFPPGPAITRKVLLAAVRVRVTGDVEDGLNRCHPVVRGDADGERESSGGARGPEVVEGGRGFEIS